MQKGKSTKAKKKKKKEPRVPPATAFEPGYWYVFRVNKPKTIYKLMSGKYVNQAEAEMVANKLTLKSVVSGRSYFYVPFDSQTALYLWIGYDVRY